MRNRVCFTGRKQFRDPKNYREKTIMGATIRAALAAAALIAASQASAACFGSQNMYTCNDNSGNSYQVNRMGSTTTVNGYNAQTGSSWNQQSHHYGNTTQTYGSAANGSSWNSTTRSHGNGYSSTYGTDSRGRNFSRQCGPYGCN